MSEEEKQRKLRTLRESLQIGAKYIFLWLRMFILNVNLIIMPTILPQCRGYHDNSVRTQLSIRSSAEYKMRFAVENT